MSSCELVSRAPRDAAIADVVFLHGIQGDPKKSWTNENGGFWPAWLADECPELAVWTVGYEAAVSAWTGTSMSLFDRANNVLALVQEAGIGDRPICWMTHSMGGLLVKQMLRNADGLAPEFKPISAAACCVVFIATPHTGSDVASMARFLGGVLRINAAGKELQALSAPLLDLNTWYRENHRRLGLATQVFFENQATRGVHIVDRGSADPGLESVIPIGLDADHSGICKPAGKTELIYTRTKTFMCRELVNSADRPTPRGSGSAPTTSAEAPANARASAADLAGLNDDQVRALRECVAALRHAAGCLADLRQTPCLATDFGEISAQAESAVDAAGDKLRVLSQHVGVRTWPDRDWALQFSDAERHFRRNSVGGYQSPATRLSGPIASALRALENRYPSLRQAQEET